MTRLYLDFSEELIFKAVCLFFLNSKKNRPMQGQIAPDDHDGRFQGSTSMQVLVGIEVMANRFPADILMYFLGISEY